MTKTIYNKQFNSSGIVYFKCFYFNSTEKGKTNSLYKQSQNQTQFCEIFYLQF